MVVRAAPLIAALVGCLCLLAASPARCASPTDPLSHHGSQRVLSVRHSWRQPHAARRRLAAMPRGGGACNSTSDCNDNDCDATAGCICETLYEGRFCQATYSDKIGGRWTLFWVVCWIAFVPLFFVQTTHSVAVAWTTLRIRKEKRKPLNVRDWIGVVNSVALALRCVWVIDPKGVDLYGEKVSDLLLRLPQSLWLAELLVMVLVWDSIVKAASRKRPSSYGKTLVGFLVLLLLIVSVPATIIMVHSEHLAEEMVLVQNIVFAVYSFGLVAAGLWYSRKLMSTLAAFKDNERIQAVLSNVKNTIFFVTTLGSLVVVSVVVDLVDDIEPFTQEDAYLAFLFVVHLCESGFAAAMYYSVSHHRGITRGRSFRLRSSSSSRSNSKLPRIGSGRTPKTGRSKSSGSRRGLNSQLSDPHLRKERDIVNPLNNASDVELTHTPPQSDATVE